MVGPQESARFINVLIVEDRPLARKLLEAELKSAPDIRIAGTARNGREGVDRVRSDNPDVVIMDIVMPEMDGVQALAEIRKFSRVPVIMFSGSHDTSDTLRYITKRQGADAFLVKPSGSVSADIYKVREELLATIRALAARAG